MLLRNILLDPNKSYLHMERYVNIGSPSGFTNKYNTSISTSAKGDSEGFYLCSVKFPPTIKYQDFGEQSPIIDKFNMLVHPDMIKDELFNVCSDIEEKALFVAPTSSARTVRILDKDGWFLKLCYKGLIGRIDRQLARKHALAAIEVSSAIQKAMENHELSETFYFYRELSARVVDLPNKDKIYEWGIVTREPHPFPHDKDIEIIIPGFSLFSPDEKKPNDPTLLTQLIHNQKKPADDYLFDDLLSPVFDAYFTLLLSCGMQLEAHAQNILFAFDKDLKFVGVVARDAESIDRDISLINERNLGLKFGDAEYKCLYKGQYNYHIMHSFMFDFKLGEYLIRPIIDDASKNFVFDKTRLLEKVKEYNNEYIKNLPNDFFPADGNWYMYENVVHNRSEKRRYIANSNPLCR